MLRSQGVQTQRNISQYNLASSSSALERYRRELQATMLSTLFATQLS